MQAQNVLITGCSSGFGRLIADTLLKQGHRVAATMRDPDGRNQEQAAALRAMADDSPGSVTIYDLDVTSEESVNRAIERAEKEVGPIDVVVNNAGYGAGGLAEAFTVDQWEKIFDVNVLGVQRVSRAVLPGMRKRGRGLLVNVSSTMGRLVIPFAAPYTASKYALEGMTESYRYELSGTGVDVVLVEPGGFGTNFLANMDGADDADVIADYGPIADIPNQMWGGMAESIQSDDGPNPQAVADAVSDLIATPAGKRPLRTVVDPMTGGQGPEAINTTTDHVQTQLFSGFGMEQLLSVSPES